jgi:regulatory protein
MNYKDALKYSMALCSSQERCRSDVAGKLRDRDLSEADIDKILSTLEKENFLNETRFATSFARDKLKFNKWGKLKIRYALSGKQITEEIMDQALSGIDEDFYAGILREELQKKRKSIKGSNAYDLKGRLFRFAQQRGFESGLIYSILDEII